MSLLIVGLDTTIAAHAMGVSFAAATHTSWWIIVGLGIAVLCLALLTTTGWAHETAHRRERFREGRRPARYEPQEVATG